MVRWVLVALLCAASGRASAQTVVDETASKIPDPIRSAVLRIVSDKFGDPVGTQFRRLGSIESKTPNTTMACGQVNAKNSYGAYVGFQLFNYIKEDSTEVVHLTDFKTLSKIGQSRPELIALYIKAGCMP